MRRQTFDAGIRDNDMGGALMAVSRKLLIFETHPVQYRAPVFQELERLVPGNFEVVFASDCSVRGRRDPGFGEKFAWDVPLLEGYPFRVLGNERGVPLSSWGSLTGKGIYRLMREIRPRAVLMHSFSYRYDLAIYLAARALGIPIWIRIETQDEAFERGRFKSIIRSIIYRALYTGVKKAFYIGKLNRAHYLRHGMRPGQLLPAHYCTPDRLAGLTVAEKTSRRRQVRERMGIPHDKCVVAFFGKLIPKKDPGLLLASAERLPREVRDRIVFLFVGSGELDEQLRRRSEEVRHATGIASEFAGFVNQTGLPDYFLASDIVVLPSRRMGETWGLVVNEGIQAGCGVIVSEAVGSSRNFGAWDRVRVIPVGDAAALAGAIGELAAFPRDFDWAAELMKEYSIEAAAHAIAGEIRKLQGDETERAQSWANIR
jgi:glycosyltransferase involved in cell wall biosynthesis